MKGVKKAFYLFLSLYLMSCNYAEPVDYILKNKEEGWYAVIYDCENGKKKNYIDGRLQNIFPENNIIITSYPDEFGIVDNRFFYFEDGKKKEFFPSYHKNDDEDFSVFGPTQVSTITYERTIFYFGKDSDERTNKSFREFSTYVDNYIKRKGIQCGKNR